MSEDRQGSSSLRDTDSSVVSGRGSVTFFDLRGSKYPWEKVSVSKLTVIRGILYTMFFVNWSSGGPSETVHHEDNIE